MRIAGPVSATQPAQPEKRQGPGETRECGEPVPAHRVGRGELRRVRPHEEQGHADPEGSDQEQVGASNRLAQQPGGEQEQVEGRGVLEKDGVGGRGQLVREHE